MAWTTPKTDWTTGELVTAEDMNAIAENLVALKHPPTVVGTTTQDVSSRSGEFSDVDSDNLNLTITTTGGDVLLYFEGRVRANHATKKASVYFDIDVDGYRQGQANGLRSIGATAHASVLSITRLIRNLSAGTHTFKLQWRHYLVRDRTTGRLETGAQFWVREI